MHRKISPFSDVLALFKLWGVLRRVRPHLIHTHTPKAGLLGMLASRLSGVPVRIYTINGLVWITSAGFQRRLLIAMERLACALATNVLAVSSSIQQITVNSRICPSWKIRVLGSGGSHGVDLERFDPVSCAPEREALRSGLRLNPNSILLIFVGRLVRQKGVEDLAVAWRGIRDEYPEAHLLLCGAFEERDSVSPEVVEDLRKCARVHFVSGSPDEMPGFYAASDICVLPTWREGLPNVALEAAAMQIPIVATNAPGCVDAIEDGVTGILVGVQNSESLKAGLRRLMDDAALRRQMGQNGRRFVAERFSENRVSQLLSEEYKRLLAGFL